MASLTHCDRCGEDLGKLRIPDHGEYHETECEFCGLLVPCLELDAAGFPPSLARHSFDCVWIGRFTAYIEALIDRMG